MQCLVYRSRRRADTYVLVESAEALADLPAGLHSLVGELEFAFEFALTPGRRLARTEAETVAASIRQTGYYLQLPPEPPQRG